MNRIEMYTSSSDLKIGLHRVLAMAHALAEPLEEGTQRAWWTHLAEADQAAARAHTLSLDALAQVYAGAETQRLIDEARAALALQPVDHGLVQAAFRTAVISGKAHRAHLGRDVYGSSNKGLWDLVCADFGRACALRFGQQPGGGPVSPEERRAPSGALERLRELSAFDTSPGGPDHGRCVEWLRQQLLAAGFTVDVVEAGLGPPLVVAHRSAQKRTGHVVMYGHYDVTPFGLEEKWAHPPRSLTQSDGRLFARGVADNKGPLACRLAALSEMDATPELTWLIQGEEETGSTVAHALLPDIMGDLSQATVWLDETGYHDHEDGTLRLLGRTIGPHDTSLPPDPALNTLLRALGALASRWGVAARYECRGLNKSVIEGGCPFNGALPAGARYLALGVNDSAARIHGLNESLPEWTFSLHAAEFDVVFQWVHCLTGGEL